MSSNYTSGAGSAGNNNSSGSRREREERWHNAHASNGTGALPPVNTMRSSYTGAFDFEEMLSSLRELFAHDRQTASQLESKRCGICYLYFTVNELRYREEEGFYSCPGCERTLGKQTLPMVRRQQK